MSAVVRPSPLGRQPGGPNMFGPPGWRPKGEGLTTADIRRKAGLVDGGSNQSSQPVMT